MLYQAHVRFEGRPMIHIYRDDLNRRLLWIAREPVSIEDVLEATDRQALEGAWSYPLLYDARDRRGTLTREELDELNRHVKAHTQQYGPRGRIAVVVAPRAYGMRRMIKFVGNLLGVENRVFSRVGPAKAWLGRDASRAGKPARHSQ